MTKIKKNKHKNNPGTYIITSVRTLINIVGKNLGFHK